MESIRRISRNSTIPTMQFGYKKTFGHKIRDGIDYFTHLCHPIMKHILPNFIAVHYAYIIGLTLLSSILMYPIKNFAYIDILFLAAGATTQGGLNTINLNALTLYQQIILYITCMIATPIWIHGGLAFVRLYWFERYFDGIRDWSKMDFKKRRTKTIIQQEHLKTMPLVRTAPNGKNWGIFNKTFSRNKVDDFKSKLFSGKMVSRDTEDIENNDICSQNKQETTNGDMNFAPYSVYNEDFPDEYYLHVKFQDASSKTKDEILTKEQKSSNNNYVDTSVPHMIQPDNNANSVVKNPSEYGVNDCLQENDKRRGLTMHAYGLQKGSFINSPEGLNSQQCFKNRNNERVILKFNEDFGEKKHQLEDSSGPIDQENKTIGLFKKDTRKKVNLEPGYMPYGIGEENINDEVDYSDETHFKYRDDAKCETIYNNSKENTCNEKCPNIHVDHIQSSQKDLKHSLQDSISMHTFEKPISEDELTSINSKPFESSSNSYIQIEKYKTTSNIPDFHNPYNSLRFPQMNTTDNLNNNEHCKLFNTSKPILINDDSEYSNARLNTRLRLHRTMSTNYLSYEPKIGRNSIFFGLTESQKSELGGVEYRAIKVLCLILVIYYAGFHIMTFILLVPWINNTSKYSILVKNDGISPTWWGFWTSMSAFNNLGLTLTPDSMISFQSSAYSLIILMWCIVIGNTGFPILLRFIIWCSFKILPELSSIKESLGFLLDHPRRCFTLLFPSGATWWLFIILITLNVVDSVLFIVLDINILELKQLKVRFRVLDGLFQAISTRTAGFSVVDLGELHPSVQVSYMLMMYLSVMPLAISIRRTNVYEEQSLGIYGNIDGENLENHTTSPRSFIGAHLRKQLSFDLWFVFLGLFIICISEGNKIKDPSMPDFTIFQVLFEVVSAYGTVGLSLGYPGTDQSFSAQFNHFSKLIIIIMLIRGRHRGLPYTLDRAIVLPSDKLREIDKLEDIKLQNGNLNPAYMKDPFFQYIKDKAKLVKKTVTSVRRNYTHIIPEDEGIALGNPCMHNTDNN